MEGQKGFTLVEILAALVILGIVFISILTIFPQMTLFNEHTNTKLDTMNLVREEMRQVETASFTSDSFSSEIAMKSAMANVLGLNISNVQVISNTNGANNEWEVEYTKNAYDFLLTIDRTPQVKGVTSLYQVSLVIQYNNKLNSKTYGYVTVH